MISSFVRIEEAAEAAGVSGLTIRLWAKDGKIMSRDENGRALRVLHPKAVDCICPCCNTGHRPADPIEWFDRAGRGWHDVCLELVISRALLPELRPEVKKTPQRLN